MDHTLFKLPGDEKRLESRLRPRQQFLDRSLIQDIMLIFERVEASGDNAIIEATKRFDQVEISGVAISEEYVDRCVSELPGEFKTAVERAIANISEVNLALMPEPEWSTEIRPGTIIGERSTPLDSVGLYVPATKGPLVSTALMLVTSARVAGVKRIVVAMPPQKNGRANPSTVAAAKLAGAHEMITGNGVSLIAGLTVGTASAPEVDGIYGPGPRGIAAAMSVSFSYGKRTLVGIGPTDCAIVADETARPEWIAADLLCETEHGPDSSALLVTTSQTLADQTLRELERRISLRGGTRGEILASVFGDQGMGSIVVVPDLAAACRVVNAFAPEHLMLSCSEENMGSILENVEHAGEILLGEYTPFAAANFAMGITAVLPTNRFARAFSGITCRDMLKTSTVGKLSKSALDALRPTIQAIGMHEGFPCHLDSVTVRFQA